MHDERPSENRFRDCAQEVFDFLVHDFGFRCVTSEPARVGYESSSVWFEVGYSVTYDHEVWARVGRFGAAGLRPDESAERLDFGLLLSVADSDSSTVIERKVPASIAHTEEHVRQMLSYFAAGLRRRYGMALLSGDERAYAQSLEVRWWHAPNAPI